MSAPLKTLQLEVRPHTHTALSRIAESRGITLRELGREIIESYVAKAIHDAKVVLGLDENNEHGTDSHVARRNRPESDGGGRK